MKYVIIDTDYHMADFYVSKADAVTSFNHRIASEDRSQNMILMELKMPKRPGAPKAKIIGIRSQGYVVGTWPPKK